MDTSSALAPLAVPGDWQGPETPEHWWCRRCGRWARCDDRDICRRCTRRLAVGRSRTSAARPA